MVKRSWPIQRGGDDRTVSSYIVRIYRRRSELEVTGMVEFPELDTSLPFHNFEELRSILRDDTRGETNRTRVASCPPANKRIHEK